MRERVDNPVRPPLWRPRAGVYSGPLFPTPMKKHIVASLVLLPLAACSWGATPTPNDDENTTVVTERPETKNVIYRGRLMPLGSSIYMEGTHRLELEDGRFVLLESNGVLLDEYLGKDVEVTGATRATIEGSAIIMRVEGVAELSASSAPAESSSSSSMAPVASSSSEAPIAASSAPPVVISSAKPVVISSAPAVVVSSAPAAASSAPAASSAGMDAAMQAKVTAMAKAKMDAANWSQQYCAPSHLAFCFPVHKNWWYTSFGATSSSLWHVEMSSEELVSLGDGPIAVVLVSGNASVPDGTVSTSDGKTLGIRAWTNGRHIEIRGPAALAQAVAYITAELKPAPAPASSAAAAQ